MQESGLFLNRLEIERKFQNPAARDRLCPEDCVFTVRFGTVTVPEHRHRVSMPAYHRPPVNRMDHVKQWKDAVIALCDSGKVRDTFLEHRGDFAVAVTGRAVTCRAGGQIFLLPDRILLRCILSQNGGCTQHTGRRQNPRPEHCFPFPRTLPTFNDVMLAGYRVVRAAH